MIPFCESADLNEVVALGTCGVPVRIAHISKEKGNTRVTSFQLELSNAVTPEAKNALNDRIPQSPDHFITQQMRLLVQTGALAQRDPVHPLLDCLAVLEARESYLNFMRTGQRYHVDQIPGVARSRLLSGQEPLAYKLGQPGFEVWTTEDIALVSALSRCGFPVLTIDGTEGHRRFVLPRYSKQDTETRRSRSPHLPISPSPRLPLSASSPIDALTLIPALRDGSLKRDTPSHPLLWGMAALKNRLYLLQQIDAQEYILLHKRGVPPWITLGTHARMARSALVPPHASNAEMDSVRKHLGIP